jgi:hypothetical protein
MALLDIRQRVGWLFMTVTACISYSSPPSTSKRGVPLLQEAIFGSMAELQRVATVGIRRGTQRVAELREPPADCQENDTLKQRGVQLEVGVGASARWRSRHVCCSRRST